MTLQQIIQRYRQNSGLSYEAIARQLDVSRSTVCRWASGEIRTVQSETKQRLSALIRHDVDALLEQEARFLEKPVLGTIKAGYDMFADQQLLGYEPVSEQEAASGRLLFESARQQHDQCRHPGRRPALRPRLFPGAKRRDRRRIDQR